MLGRIMEFPRTVIVGIIATFLSEQSVAKLDSAICSAVFRQPWLDLLSCDECSLKMANVDRDGFLNATEACLKWCVARSVKIRSLHWSLSLFERDPGQIANLVNLTCRHLELLVCEQFDVKLLGGILMLQFDRLKELQWYQVTANSLHLETILSRAPLLETLCLPYVYSLDGKRFASLVLVHVKTLNLTGSCPDWLSSVCPNTTALRFGLDCPPECIRISTSFRQLRQLTYRGSLNDAELMRVADGCPLLSAACFDFTPSTLHDVTNITDSGVTYLCSKCTRLESIVLSNCRALTRASLRAISAYLSTTLRRLNIQGCVRVGGLGQLRACRLLEFLNVSNTCTEPDTTLVQLFTKCALLRDVVVDRKTIDDAALLALAHHCSALEVLSIKHCTGYTLVALVELVECAVRLKKLVAAVVSPSNMEDFMYIQSLLRDRTGCSMTLSVPDISYLYPMIQVPASTPVQTVQPSTLGSDPNDLDNSEDSEDSDNSDDSAGGYGSENSSDTGSSEAGDSVAIDSDSGYSETDGLDATSVGSDSDSIGSDAVDLDSHNSDSSDANASGYADSARGYDMGDVDATEYRRRF